ncbi:hypothetical protein J6590_066259 [Homalodisca vitripennis]|nr:hypothetical protein J6590_066259 [Homalodisca vitripennis]
MTNSSSQKSEGMSDPRWFSPRLPQGQTPQGSHLCRNSPCLTRIFMREDDSTDANDVWIGSTVVELTQQQRLAQVWSWFLQDIGRTEGMSTLQDIRVGFDLEK